MIPDRKCPVDTISPVVITAMDASENKQAKGGDVFVAQVLNATEEEVGCEIKLQDLGDGSYS